MSSEGAKSCYPNKNNPEGVLLLCEVDLGNCHETDDPKARDLPEGKDSIKIQGQTRPDPNNSVTLHDVIVPMGRIQAREGGTAIGYSLLYNRYVIYNPAQVRMRYLLRIRFNFP
ncbi:poly [ADP-ribose] polymerase 2-like [Mugil cephalus]|uniref:poly [ADP-ribose] polymerase 2-like n=1 Tax=Mugil cephalus TaxID=48193 RepID=UPI001FB75E3C|nr:poly [ADP-ribose] polymerase 2-like [Mugil cephalus]